MRHSKRTVLTTDDVDSALNLRNVEVLFSYTFFHFFLFISNLYFVFQRITQAHYILKKEKRKTKNAGTKSIIPNTFNPIQNTQVYPLFSFFLFSNHPLWGWESSYVRTENSLYCCCKCEGCKH